MSLLDTDFYKFTVGQIIYNTYPKNIVTYKLFDRTNKLNWDNTDFTNRFIDKLVNLSDKSFLEHELIFLRKLGLSKTYIEFLRKFKFDSRYVSLDDGLTITGPWAEVCLFEVPILSILSECHYQNDTKSLDEFNDICQCRLANAGETGIKFTEFGTRRRRSKLHQEWALRTFLPILEGTSNVELGMKYNLPVVGTLGHELPMGLLGFYDKTEANLYAHVLFDINFDLQYVLTDTFTTDKFIKDHGHYLRRYNVRQDSGSTTEYIDKMVAFYKHNNVDPLNRTILFTDSLNIQKCVSIRDYCKDKIGCKFGLGTSLVNPFDDKLGIVIKIIKSNNKNVYKITDDLNKSINL